jgi:hypothetical protein
MSFINNLFGAIAGQTIFRGTTMDRIPTDDKGTTIEVKGDNVSWLGMRSRYMQKYAYDFCYPVSSVVDRLAEYDLTGEVEITRAKGKGKENEATGTWATNMRRRFARPNPLQSWEQFRGQQVVYKRVFGFCPVMPIVPVGFTPDNATAIINLPPWLFDVVAQETISPFASSINDIVKHWTLTIWGKTIELKAEWVFLLEDSFIMDENSKYILPQSKLVGLDMAISNICAAMEADNVLLKKRGPLGFISHEAATKDNMVGYLPMEPEEKLELQQDLQQYGLSWSQFLYVISKTPARWNPMSFDTKQLGTKETVVAGEEAICHRYGYPYILYRESDATYANGAQAATSVYYNNVIPNANKDASKYNQFFLAEQNNAEIEFCFDDVPFLQDDEETKANARKAMNENCQIEYDNNLITLNQWREKMGYNTVPGDDTYKRDSAPSTVPMPTGVDVNTMTNGNAQ